MNSQRPKINIFWYNRFKVYTDLNLGEPSKLTNKKTYVISGHVRKVGSQLRKCKFLFGKTTKYCFITNSSVSGLSRFKQISFYTWRKYLKILIIRPKRHGGKGRWVKGLRGHVRLDNVSFGRLPLSIFS